MLLCSKSITALSSAEPALGARREVANQEEDYLGLRGGCSSGQRSVPAWRREWAWCCVRLTLTDRLGVAAGITERTERPEAVSAPDGSPLGTLSSEGIYTLHC